MVCVKRLLSQPCDSRAKNNMLRLNNVSSVIQTDKSQWNLKGPCQSGSKNNSSQLCFGEWVCVLMCCAPSTPPLSSWAGFFFLKRASSKLELCHLVTQLWPRSGKADPSSPTSLAFGGTSLSRGAVWVPLPYKCLWDGLPVLRQVGQGSLPNRDSPSELPKIPCSSVNRHGSASLHLAWPCLTLLQETNLGFASLWEERFPSCPVLLLDTRKKCIKDVYEACACEAAALKRRRGFSSFPHLKQKWQIESRVFLSAACPCAEFPEVLFFFNQSEAAINSCWGIPSRRNLSKAPLPYAQKQLPWLPFPLPHTHPLSCYPFCPFEASVAEVSAPRLLRGW